MPIRGEAEARLGDGRTLKFKVNFATLARASAQAAMPAGELMKAVATAQDPRQMLALLAVTQQGLRLHHPDIDEDALGDLMLSDGEAIGQAVMAAFEGAFGGPEQDAEERDQPNPPKRGTSTPSKPRGRKRA